MAKLNSRISRNGHHPANLIRSASERLVLGALLLFDPAGCPAWEALDVSDFAITDHQIVYRRMQALHRHGAPLSYAGLWQEMQSHTTERHISLSQLSQITEGVPVLGEEQWHYLITSLREATRLRRIAAMGQDLARAAEDGAHIEVLAREFRERLEAFAEAGDELQLSASIGDVWSRESHTTYLVADFIAEQSITMISGESGDGKSMLGLALAAAVAQGLPFLGRTTIARPVLYLDREMPLYVVKDRMATLAIPRLFPQMRVWGGWEPMEPPGPESPMLLAYARKDHPLIIFDPLVRNLGGADENDAAQIRQRMTLYRKLTEAGASIVLKHHASEKSEADYRGSSDFRAAVDSAWRLTRDDGSTAGDALGRLLLTPYKLRAEPIKPIRMEYREGVFVPLDQPPRSALEIVIDLVRCYPGSTQKELRKLGPSHGLSERKVVQALEQGQLQGKLEIDKDRRSHAQRYHLREVYLGEV